MSSPSRLLPNGDWVRALIAPALAFIATALNRNYQTDFWHHLARGRAMAESGSLVDHDLFTYTVAGQPFQDSNWLPQLFYFFLFEHGGLALVQTINSLILALVMGGVVWLCWRKSKSMLLSAGLAVFAFFGLWQLLIIRPQTFSLLLFVALYAALELSDRSKWYLLIPPVLLVLWANLHGGFPVGLILVSCYVLAAFVKPLTEPVPDNVTSSWRPKLTNAMRSVWPWALCLAVCLAATCVNPYGWRIYQYVGVTSSTASARRIDEWVPPGLDLLVGRVWVVSVVAVVVLFALPKRRPTVREICLVLVFLAMACGGVRMVAWWLLIVPPIAAVLLIENLPKSATIIEPEKPSWAATGCVVALLAGMILCAPVLEAFNPMLGTLRTNHRDEDDLNVVADRVSREEPNNSRRIFSRFEWGEYLGWRLRPEGYTIFMDARIEIYPDDIWNQYSAVTQGRADWQEILDQHQVDVLLLDRTYHQAGLLPQVLKATDRWRRVGGDEGKAILFVRQSGVKSASVR
jgi:hypothetical protein